MATIPQQAWTLESTELPRCLIRQPTEPQAQRILPPTQPVSPPSLTNYYQPALPLFQPIRAANRINAIDPNLRRIGVRLATATIEALAGLRPPAQLRLRFVPAVVTFVTKLCRTPATKGLHIRSVKVQSPTDGVLEISIVMRQGPHICAAALRATKLAGVWIGTRFEIALHPGRVLRVP